jgi:hypothetical protein
LTIAGSFPPCSTADYERAALSQVGPNRFAAVLRLVRLWNLEIGFVFQPSPVSYIHISPYNTYSYITLTAGKLALFFHNHTQARRVFLRCGILGLAPLRTSLNWLCFLETSKHGISHNPLCTRMLRSVWFSEIGFVFSKTIIKLLGFVRFKGT